MAPKFLVHRKGDYVGVATEDISKGERVEGVFMDTLERVVVEALSDIPLGHKIALRDIQRGEKVVEYGEVIGAATQPIKRGEHVHIHNIRSLRW